MRLAAVVLVGCAHARPAPTPLTEAEVIARSHAVLDAFDRGDAAALRDALASGFIRFDSGKLTTRDKVLERVSAQPPHAPDMTRGWNEEHAYVRANDAVFIGMSVEHETGNDSHGNREYDGWYTMAWTRDGDVWRVTHWTWRAHHTALEEEREVWNDTFRQSIGFEHEPNRLLVDTVKGKPPGRALDVMMGQGRNAVFLASQGWKVTGVDISDEGIRIARDTAAKKGVALDAVQADAESYDFGTAKWDLVTMIYAGNNDKIVDKIKPSLKPGGLFVVEFFAATPTDSGGFKAGQLAKAFGDGFEILRDDVVDDRPDWARDKAKLVRFVARKR
jgi:SAM-dependent methyltransferase